MKIKLKEVCSIDLVSILIGAAGGIAVGAVICGMLVSNVMFKKGVEHRKKIAEAEIGSAEEEKVRIIAEATKLGENKKREVLYSAKEEISKSKTELDKEIKERRNEILRIERKLDQKEDVLNKKLLTLESKEEIVSTKIKELSQKQEESDKIKEQQIKELERIAGLTSEDARQYLLGIFENEIRHDMALMLKEHESKAKEDAEKKAKEIISTAIQKCAADHASEITVSVVVLPNDEMKGRIIGREGRNIRTLETLTGIDLIIDDTPEAVIISGFDPIRREVARIALEKLIVDGRIHPARIEEMVEKAKKEVDNTIRQEGENASFETGVHGLNPEVIKLLGRLKYRTSYGQNVLNHSVEVAHLAGIMAAELGEDVTVAKRAGLLHDIGKSIDHEVEGSHIMIGADICRKYKESSVIVNAVEAHHGDVEAQTIIAVLVQAADSISAARPGARRETLESYIKRLEKLEHIVTSFSGVEKCYAIQAGREVRVMVKPEDVNDEDMILKSREICKQIEAELDYPGQIKVTVIRETRTIDFAK